MLTPYPRSYWVMPGRLLAGYYPGAPDPVEAAGKLQVLFDVGIRCIVNLMEPDERDHRHGGLFADYSGIFAEIAAEQQEAVSCLRFPVPDLQVPDIDTMHRILDAIDAAIEAGRPVYVHCWSGIGRTGTAVGCCLIRRGLAAPETVVETIRRLREGVDAQWSRPSPETRAQIDFVRSWPRHEKFSGDDFSARAVTQYVSGGW